MSNVIFIPYWIKETLHRNGLNINDVADLRKVRPFLSANDLATLICLQSFDSYLYGDNQAGEDVGMGYSLVCLWDKNLNDEERQFLNNTLIPISVAETTRSEVQSRLFSPESLDERHEKPFITYDLAPSVCGVVIYPGFFCESNRRQLALPLIEGVLKLFYAYNPFHKVAGMDVFKKYLAQLAGKTVIV